MQQITIVGTGLIGGSLALGLKKHGFTGRIVGCDRGPVLARAKALGAIDLGFDDPRRASQGSDVVVLATPVGAVIELLENLGPVLPPATLLTDVGSTKQEIVARARKILGEHAARRFLPGHPMAGKESGGIEHADPELFKGAIWLITPLAADIVRQPQAADFLQWTSRLGARIVSLDAVRHDRLCAWVSHLPQMLATALAASLQEEFSSDPELHAIGGRALREMTRIASSPYSMWRDIALTNTGNIQEALLRLEQRLAHLRENLRSRGLEEEFTMAARFRQS